jgi:hypothetical protein
MRRGPGWDQIRLIRTEITAPMGMPPSTFHTAPYAAQRSRDVWFAEFPLPPPSSLPASAISGREQDAPYEGERLRAYQDATDWVASRVEGKNCRGAGPAAALPMDSEPLSASRPFLRQYIHSIPYTTTAGLRKNNAVPQLDRVSITLAPGRPRLCRCLGPNQRRQVQPMFAGAIDSDVVTGIGVAHDTACRIVPQHPFQTPRGGLRAVGDNDHAGVL